MTAQTKIGTFAIHGNAEVGYWIEDLCTFNNWGVRRASETSNFKTQDEACDYAQRCHDFKTGRRMSV